MAEAEGAIVKYDQTPASRFYACRKCDTHIALSDCIEWEVSKYIVATNPVNLKTDASENHPLTESLIMGIARCAGCNTVLGEKFVRVDPAYDFYYQGNVLLILKRLLFWNGNQMLDAFTKLPPDNPAGQ